MHDLRVQAGTRLDDNHDEVETCAHVGIPLTPDQAATVAGWYESEGHRALSALADGEPVNIIGLLLDCLDALDDLRKLYAESTQEAVEGEPYPEIRDDETYFGALLSWAVREVVRTGERSNLVVTRRYAVVQPSSGATIPVAYGGTLDDATAEAVDRNTKNIDGGGWVVRTDTSTTITERREV